MPTLVIPNTFTPNTTALSAQVNANFNAVATLINSTKFDNSNIQTGGITGANIAASTITKDKLNSNVVDNSTVFFNGGGAIAVNTGGVDTAQLTALVANALCPTGSVLAYAATSAPTGWLACDGTAVSRVTYATLFALMGITHGSGDGVTTFNVPDYRGRFLRGVDGGATRDPDTLTRTAMATGGNTGDNVGSVQDEDFKSHAHLEQTANGSGGVSSLLSITGTATPQLVNTSTAATGGNETRPKNAYVSYIIKT